MKGCCKYLTALAVVMLLLAPAVSRAGAKLVLVHYMPWFVAEPFSSSWGWHWTMNHFNPNTIDSNGRREIASWYYPLIGPYDSLDPDVLEYHVLLMKLAGIDGVIVDWYGADNYNDYGVNNQRTRALLNYTRKAGLKFSLCYEDQTIRQEINGNYITAAGAVAHAQQTMLYAQSNYFADPGFLRLNQSPVLLNFGPQYFTNSSDWLTIFAPLNATNQPALFTEDNRLASGVGAFDWPPMWLSGGGSNVLTSAQLTGYLTAFDQKAAAWPSQISSAFPRFHDIYSQAGVSPSYGLLDDANGATLANTFTRALTNHSAFVQLVTWNDFGEGTIIEPTLQYGYRDLGIVQDLRRQYLDPQFPYHTNDLALAFRLYTARKQYGASATLAAEMDRIFTNLVHGAISNASAQLNGLETNRLVIYNPIHTETQLQFDIGGYVAQGAQVEVSTNLTSWQVVQSLSATTNLLTFTTALDQSACRFFRVE